MKKVVVYSAPFCAPCIALKKYLQSKNIMFENRDLMIDEDAGDYLESKGVRGSPVLQVDDTFYVGPQITSECLEKIFFQSSL